MGVTSGLTTAWKLETEEGREHVRTKLINRSGLLATFDASVKKSYNGGNTWHDLSGNNNDILLTNVTFTTDKNGGLSFGSSSTGRTKKFFINNLSTGFTMSAWIKHTGTVDISRAQRYATLEPEVASLRHNNSSAASFQAYVYNTSSVLASIDSPSRILTNVYYNVAMTYSFTGTNNVKSYINGSFIGATTLAGTARVNREVSIGAIGTEYFQGNMYAMTIYNRPLTDQEIYKNYLATRDRFI